MRELIFAAIVASTLSVISMAATAEQKSWTWVVPEGVEKINIESVVGDTIVIDRNIKVEPGQIFKVETIE